MTEPILAGLLLLGLLILAVSGLACALVFLRGVVRELPHGSPPEWMTPELRADGTPEMIEDVHKQYASLTIDGTKLRYTEDEIEQLSKAGRRGTSAGMQVRERMLGDDGFADDPICGPSQEELGLT